MKDENVLGQPVIGKGWSIKIDDNADDWLHINITCNDYGKSETSIKIFNITSKDLLKLSTLFRKAAIEAKKYDNAPRA